MKELFDRCIKVILKNEGGYANHPADPGGETKYGITKRYFPDEDIKNLTKKRAIDIYYRRYWLPMGLWRLCNENIILQIFDFGVNAGKYRATKTAQRVAKVKEDGIFGRVTAHAINNYQGDYLKNYKYARKIYYEWLANQDPRKEVFLEGWLKRIKHTKL